MRDLFGTVRIGGGGRIRMGFVEDEVFSCE